MKKLSALLVLLSSSLVLAAPTFTIGGSALSLPSVQQGGKVYVDAAALARALGYTLSFDQTKNTYVVSAQAPTGPTGSGQLAGGLGTPGRSYSVGQGGDAVNFTLNSAEFVATRVNIGQQSYTPAADQKLLVLHYTVQNPGKSGERYYESTLQFAVVDDQNTNRRYVEAVGKEGSSDALDVSLKPAQKIDAYTVIPLPAGSSAPKLIVQAGSGPVLRYDLHGLVKPVAAPYADPQHPQMARADVPAALGSFLQIGGLDVRLDGVALSDAAIAGTAPSAGHRYFIAALTLRNSTPSQQRVSYNNLLPVMRLASGDTATWNQRVLKAGSDDSLDVNLTPGAEVHARLSFEVPTTDAPKTLSLAQDTSHRLVFDVSPAK